MGPSQLRRLSLALLLTTTFLAIANADNSTTTADAPVPSLTPASPPPPPPPPPATPGWTTVTDVSDLAIQQVGQFSVLLNALSTGMLQLRFVNVVSGQTQPFNGGCNYELLVTVSSGPAPNNYRQYHASVWGMFQTTSWKLWSFTLV